MAKKARGKSVSRRTRTVSTPYRRTKVPSCSPPAMTTNIASSRKRKSVKDSEFPQDDSEDTMPKKRVKLETNICLPITNITNVTSTQVTSATTSSSNVFTFSPPIKIKTPVSIQCTSCSSEERVEPKFTFSPAASITRRPPINSSSNTSSTTMTSSATTFCSIAVKSSILSKSSTSSSKKRVQFETNISSPISKIPKLTSTLVTSVTTSSIPTASTAPIESTETRQAIKSWTRPFTRSSRNTFKNSSSKSTTPATHTPPEPFRIGQGTNALPASSQSSLFSSTFQPSCFSMPTTSTESNETTQPIKSWTRPFKRSSRKTLKKSPSTSSTPAIHTPPEPFRIGQGTNTHPAQPQSPLSSSKKRVQFETNISSPISKIPKLTSTLVTSATTSSSDVFTFSHPIEIKTPVSIQSTSCSSTFQPSCFSTPTTSTESTEMTQPIKSWTRPFKRSSRKTLKKSPSTSSTPATHTPPEPFRIGQGTNTHPAQPQNPLSSSTLQSSSFAMSQDLAGTSEQPSPFSAASNLDQQSSSPSSTVPSKKQ